MKTLPKLFLTYFPSLFIFFFCFSPFLLTAQSGSIVIDDNTSIEALVKSLFPNDGSVTIDNIQFFGDERAIGGFSNGGESIKIPNGLILSTGDVKSALGPNNLLNTTTRFDVPSFIEPDLAELIDNPNLLYDLARIEFDIISTETNFSIDYVFASEEYCEYVGSAFTDVFGIFVIDQSIVDSFGYESTNLAVVPNTNQTQIVSIETVNWNNNQEFYNTNVPFPFSVDGSCPVGEIFATPTAKEEIEYDGFTDVFTARYTLRPQKQYRIKIAIADVGDKLFDSAIFLQSKSEPVESIDCTFDAKWSDNEEVAREGCGLLNFEISSPLFSNPPTDFNYTYQVSDKSTATQGEDFRILTGSSVGNGLSFPIEIFEDEIEEEEETIVLEISLNCGESIVELTKKITDFVPVTLTLRDTTICPGEVFFLQPTISDNTANLGYLWSDGSGEDSLLVGGFSNELIILEVIDECENIMVDSAMISVVPNDLIASLNTFGEIEFCKNTPFYVDFDLMNNNGVVTGFQWDFGAGKSYGTDIDGNPQIEFLSSGVKQVRLQLETNTSCGFGVDTLFLITIEDCDDGLTLEIPDYEPIDDGTNVNIGFDSLKTSNNLSRDVTLNVNSPVNATLTFPILEEKENSFHNRLIIYNNLGQIIYYQKGYQNNWQGTHQSGRYLESGTYFYSLIYGQNQQKFQGGKIIYIK